MPPVISPTLNSMISETERYIMSGDRDEINRVAADVSATNQDTTITFSYELGGIQVGSYVAIDLEVMYVLSVDESAQTATVARGMLGSDAGGHLENALVYVNPITSKFDIVQALNSELANLNGKGLYRLGSFDLTAQSVERTYTVPQAHSDLSVVFEIRWDATGADNEWPLISPRSIQVLRNMPTTEFTYGMAIRIDEWMQPGNAIRVRYGGPFSPLYQGSQDVETISDLPDSMTDIPPLGAAARLIGTREAKRALTERSVDSRRAGEVGSGAAARAAALLIQLRDERISSELKRIRQTFPYRT